MQIVVHRISAELGLFCPKIRKSGILRESRSQRGVTGSVFRSGIRIYPVEFLSEFVNVYESFCGYVLHDADDHSGLGLARSFGSAVISPARPCDSVLKLGIPVIREVPVEVHSVGVRLVLVGIIGSLRVIRPHGKRARPESVLGDVDSVRVDLWDYIKSEIVQKIPV